MRLSIDLRTPFFGSSLDTIQSTAYIPHHSISKEDHQLADLKLNKERYLDLTRDAHNQFRMDRNRNRNKAEEQRTEEQY